MEPRARLLALALVATASAAIFLAPSRADDGDGVRAVREAPAILDPREHRVGERLPDAAFTDLEGQTGKLSDYAGRTLLIAVRSAGCPLGKKLAPALGRIATEYRERGVETLFVNPMEQDTTEAMRTEIADYGLAGRYVPDPKGRLAAVLGALTTTDVFVVDGARTLVYRGAVSDQYGLGYALEAPRHRYLRGALDAVLAGGRPPVEATWAPGCRLALEPAERPAADVTWNGRVARIVQRNCQECHRDGGNAPFALETYAQTKGNAAMIDFMVRARAMPPWFAAPGEHAFRNDRSLSDRDRADLLAWIEADCPEGDAEAAPLPRSWDDEWTIGTPDQIYAPSKVFDVPAEGVVPYRNAWVETRLDRDRWVTAMEVRPQSPEVVHHVLVFVRYPRDHPRIDDQPRYRGGLESYFAAMVPGQNAIRFEDGLAKFLPKGARLRFQIHYTPNGKATRDRPRLGLIYAEGPPRHELESRGIFEQRFRIPPHAKAHPVTAEHRFESRGRLLGFMPHMHVRGSAFRYELIRPGGETEVVLDVPRYDFNWQLAYRLREPIEVEPGMVLRATGVYDNSADNPANPDPSEMVRFGEQTWEEMMIGYFDWHRIE